MIALRINGEDKQVETGATLQRLLATLGVNRQHVAVEVNSELVPRENHGEWILREGDEIEIVTLVGGG